MPARSALVLLLVAATAAAFVERAAWTAAVCLSGAALLWLWRSPRQGTVDEDPMGPASTADSEGAAADPLLVERPQEVLTATIDVLREGVLVLDGDHRVLASNEAARTVLGLHGDADAQRPVAELVDWPQLAAALDRSRTGAPQGFEVDRQIGDQERRVGVDVVPRGAGATVVLFHDLSRLRQLESHRRDFVANVSHELKTPLAAIKGFVETLIDDPEIPGETRQRFLTRISIQVERLATLVADLLTLSRLDEERPAELISDPHDLVAVCKEVRRDLQPFAERRGIELSLETPERTIWVRGEREALRQVVSNLVDNAIKYTPTGGSVRATLAERNGRADLLVVDTGIGLSEQDQRRVFERFYRVDKARSRELGGTGLGLSIVKNTVHNLGGEVGVKSTLGKGSTFWVRLPIVAATAST